MIPNLLAQLYQTPHPDIKYIEVEPNGLIIVMYGNKETSQKKGRLVLKWNLENNCEDTIMSSPTNKRNSSLKES